MGHEQKKNRISRVLASVLESQLDHVNHGCEVGIWKGGLARRMLAKFPRLELLMVDPWKTYSGFRYAGQEEFDRSLLEAKEATEFASDRRIIMVCSSVRASAYVRNFSLCYAYVDGDHNYAPCLEDCSVWWPKIKPGGVLAGHDYKPHYRKGVVKAVDEFARENDLELHVEGQSIWWVKKDRR